MCEHEEHEDCMFCVVCGECKEDLDSNDVCIACGGHDETNVPLANYARVKNEQEPFETDAEYKERMKKEPEFLKVGEEYI